MSKTYPAIEIRFTPDAEHDLDLRDRLLAALDDFEPTAVEESATAWRVFFPNADARGRALQRARAFDDRLAADAADVPDEDWAERSQANLGAIRAGRIVVSPPWAVGGLQATGTEDGERVLILIVPSMGFGTGHHASTRLCLTLLQEVALDGRSVLDIGTGSGVLAIAAARMGAEHVTAIDNDPDAVESARENFALNRLDVSGVHSTRPRPIVLLLGDFRHAPPAPADVVIANLTGELLRRSAADVSRCTNAGGRCLVSGVLATEEAAVVAAFDMAHLRHVKTVAEDEWVGIVFAKQEW